MFPFSKNGKFDTEILNYTAMRNFKMLFAFVLLTNFAFAQSPLEEGGTQLNAGVGASGWGIPV